MLFTSIHVFTILKLILNIQFKLYLSLFPQKMSTKHLSFFSCLLLLLLSHLGKADRMYQVYPDTIGSTNSANGLVMERVVQTVNVNYIYQLQRVAHHTQGKYTQFPDMSLAFYLKYAQFVTITYNIAYTSSQPTVINTRVMIDDKQNKIFNRMGGYYHEPSVFATSQVWMDKGKHNVKVEYLISHGGVGRRFMPWDVAIFQVQYYQP